MVGSGYFVCAEFSGGHPALFVGFVVLCFDFAGVDGASRLMF